MSHRNPRKGDFVGKTITNIDARAINIWRISFTDGTHIAIEVDAFGHGLYGMTVCDECAAPPAPRTRRRAASRNAEIEA